MTKLQQFSVELNAPEDGGKTAVKYHTFDFNNTEALQGDFWNADNLKVHRKITMRST